MYTSYHRSVHNCYSIDYCFLKLFRIHQIQFLCHYSFYKLQLKWSQLLSFHHMFGLNRIRKEQILFHCKLGMYKQTYLSFLSVEQLTGFEPAIQLWKS